MGSSGRQAKKAICSFATGRRPNLRISKRSQYVRASHVALVNILRVRWRLLLRPATTLPTSFCESSLFYSSIHSAGPAAPAQDVVCVSEILKNNRKPAPEDDLTDLRNPQSQSTRECKPYARRVDPSADSFRILTSSVTNGELPGGTGSKRGRDGEYIRARLPSINGVRRVLREDRHRRRKGAQARMYDRPNPPNTGQRNVEQTKTSTCCQPKDEESCVRTNVETGLLIILSGSCLVRYIDILSPVRRWSSEAKSLRNVQLSGSRVTYGSMSVVTLYTNEGHTKRLRMWNGRERGNDANAVDTKGRDLLSIHEDTNCVFPSLRMMTALHCICRLRYLAHDASHEYQWCVHAFV
ncbi:hypothetical protein IMY05_C4928000100 [Salix suchowensis]|nr:hypothetical protein IMY05_C4928000100 [Salix suchowensis]